MSRDETILEGYSDLSIPTFIDGLSSVEMCNVLLLGAWDGKWKMLKAMAVAGAIDVDASVDNKNALVIALSRGDTEVLDVLFPFFKDSGRMPDPWVAWAAASFSDSVEPLVFLASKKIPPPPKGAGGRPHPCHVSVSPAVWSWWFAFLWGKGRLADIFPPGVEGAMDGVCRHKGLWGRWAEALPARQGAGVPPAESDISSIREWLGRKVADEGLPMGRP